MAPRIDLGLKIGANGFLESEKSQIISYEIQFDGENVLCVPP